MEIGDHADYSFDSSLSPSLSVVDMLANGVLVGKELPNEGLIDENNMRRVRVVVFGKVVSPQDGYSEQAQIARRNTHPFAAAAIFFDRTSDDVETSGAILYIDRAPKSGCGKFHAGQGIEPLAALSQEASDARRILEGWPIERHLHGQNIVRIEAWINAVECNVASDKQRRPDQ